MHSVNEKIPQLEVMRTVPTPLSLETWASDYMDGRGRAFQVQEVGGEVGNKGTEAGKEGYVWE